MHFTCQKNISMVCKHDFTVIFLLIWCGFLKVPLFTSQITCSSPSHPANSFYYPKLKILPPIAHVKMVKLRKNQLGLSAPYFNLPAKSNEVIDSVSGKWLVLWHAHCHYFHSLKKIRWNLAVDWAEYYPVCIGIVSRLKHGK